MSHEGGLEAVRVLEGRQEAEALSEIETLVQKRRAPLSFWSCIRFQSHDYCYL